MRPLCGLRAALTDERRVRRDDIPNSPHLYFSFMADLFVCIKESGISQIKSAAPASEAADSLFCFSFLSLSFKILHRPEAPAHPVCPHDTKHDEQQTDDFKNHDPSGNKARHPANQHYSDAHQRDRHQRHEIYPAAEEEFPEFLLVELIGHIFLHPLQAVDLSDIIEIYSPHLR